MNAADYMALADKYGYEGDLKRALTNMQQAVAIAPHNNEYKEKLERLKGLMRQKGLL